MDDATQISLVSDLVVANLRRIRSVSRMPQSEIAGRMAARGWNWTAPKVSLIESGKRGLTLDEVADLCSAMEAPLSDLLSTDGLDVSDEVALRAQVLVKGDDPWGFDSSSVLRDAAEAAKRAETLRRVEGRIARSILGADSQENRREVSAAAAELYSRDVLAERDARVDTWTAEAHDAAVYAVEPHAYRREATLEITAEIRENLAEQVTADPAVRLYGHSAAVEVSARRQHGSPILRAEAARSEVQGEIAAHIAGEAVVRQIVWNGAPTVVSPSGTEWRWNMLDRPGDTIWLGPPEPEFLGSEMAALEAVFDGPTARQRSSRKPKGAKKS